MPTLQSSRDIATVFRRGVSASGSAMVLHAQGNDCGGQGRTAVVAGRKLGNAVARNRAKRRLRAVVSAAPPPDGTDFVVVAKAPALSLTYGELEVCYRRARAIVLARAAAR